MIESEARKMLHDVLAEWERLSWTKLSQRIGSGPTTMEITGPSGQLYQIEFEAHWDDRADGDIRVVGAIDDGGLRSFAPLTSDFITRRE